MNEKVIRAKRAFKNVIWEVLGTENFIKRLNKMACNILIFGSTMYKIIVCQTD